MGCTVERGDVEDGGGETGGGSSSGERVSRVTPSAEAKTIRDKCEDSTALELAKMKAIIQRVLSASVTVDNQVVSSIGKGILVLAAVAPDDTPEDVEYMANKLVKLKMWDDDNGGRWKLSVLDLDYQVLMVSQFTLLANIKKGTKPDFHGACPPDLARGIYDSLLARTRELYLKEKKLDASKASEVVQNGVFGAMMQVALVNDGPVTFELNSPQNTVTNATSQKGTPQGSKKGTPKGTPKGNSQVTPTPGEEIATKVEEGLSLQS